MKKYLRIFFSLCCYLSFVNAQVQTPYCLNWKTDGWIVGTSTFVGLVAYSIESNSSSLTIAEINSLRKNDINPVDRISAENFNESHSTLSDMVVGLSIVSPLSLMINERLREDYKMLGVMYVETAMLAAILPSLGKGTAQRIRPFVYNSSAPLNKRLEGDAQRSFFSRHSTFAFSMAVFTSEVYSDYFPDSKYNTHVWIASLGVASTVAILRVTSGAHFISDVVVGAAVGSAIGYLIPYIHRNNSDDLSLLPNVSPNYTGFTLSLRLK